MRKIAHKMFGTAKPADDVLARVGPAETRVLWRRPWTWDNAEHYRDLNYGLAGGPTLSLGLPMPLGPERFAIEARCAALDYAFPETRGHAVPDDWLRERDHRIGVEGGLFLTIPLDATAPSVGAAARSR